MRSPVTGKRMDIVEFKDIMYLQGERIVFTMRKYLCKDTQRFFSDKELDAYNIESALNALDKKYKSRHALMIFAIIIFVGVCIYYQFIERCP